MTTKTFTFTEATEITGLDRASMTTYIEKQWICPAGRECLDSEDIARIHLIRELQLEFGVNEEAVPLILHLVDQLCFLRNKLQDLVEPQEE